MRTAESIEQAKSANPANTNENRKRRTLPEAARPYMFKPGQSGNPNGRPKKDFYAIFSQHVIEGMSDEEYSRAIAGFRASLRKGNAYVLKELADRAYGKLKEVRELTGANGQPIEYREVSTESIDERIKQLERELGYAAAIDDAGRAGIAQAGADAPAEVPEAK